MRIADKVFERLAQEVEHVFYLSGGLAADLVDALGHSSIKPICCLHEQGSGFAAVAYAQHRGFGVCLTTSGPGATNAMTPCLAAWMDSIPVLFISGNVAVQWMAAPGMRSRGTQEGKTIPMVKPITKAAFTAQDPIDVMPLLNILIAEAKDGRPGPVWLEICQDTQAAKVEE
jgi:acetolactate synthase I/II/III large subunit